MLYEQRIQKKRNIKHKILLVEYKTYKHTYKYKRHPKYVCHFFCSKHTNKNNVFPSSNKFKGNKRSRIKFNKNNKFAH